MRNYKEKRAPPDIDAFPFSKGFVITVANGIKTILIELLIICLGVSLIIVILFILTL